MNPIWEAWCCQIEVTNHCPQFCAYCTRYIRHLRNDQKFYMDLATFRKAVESLDGKKGVIGIIGGEPVLHPEFEEICLILRDELEVPRQRLGLWTSGGPRFEEHKLLIFEVFGIVAYNTHSGPQRSVCLHQPLTLASGDVVKDESYRRQLINECWVPKFWCPSINPKGCFFCEVAQALDILLDGPGGWPIEKGWWKKEPEEFQDQVERYCKFCGACVPLERELLFSKKEKISSGLLSIFKAHRLSNLSVRFVDEVKEKISVETMEKMKPHWDPSNYRSDMFPDAPNGWKNKQKTII